MDKTAAVFEDRAGQRRTRIARRHPAIQQANRPESVASGTGWAEGHTSAWRVPGSSSRAGMPHIG
eukprot:201827-Alexandrium_andersonii.AAC.1